MELEFKFCVECKGEHDFLTDCYFCSVPQPECVIVKKNDIFTCSSCSFILGNKPFEKNVCEVCYDEIELNTLPCNHKLCLQCCKNNYIGYTYTPRPMHFHEVTDRSVWPYDFASYNDFWEFENKYEKELIVFTFKKYNTARNKLKAVRPDYMNTKKFIDYENNLYHYRLGRKNAQDKWFEWEQTKIIGSKKCPFCRSTLK